MFAYACRLDWRKKKTVRKGLESSFHSRNKNFAKFFVKQIDVHFVRDLGRNFFFFEIFGIFGNLAKKEKIYGFVNKIRFFFANQGLIGKKTINNCLVDVDYSKCAQFKCNKHIFQMKYIYTFT